MPDGKDYDPSIHIDIARLRKEAGLDQESENDNSGNGFVSKLVWRAPNNGNYFIQVIPKPGNSYIC